VKPEDWLDEEDGIWESPTVPNPECDKIGCGEWNPKKIKNPFYKGKWKAPLIDNPLYKGEWSPRKVPNPNYYEDSHPSQVAAIGGIGVDIWTTNAEISFDNILITHSLEAAFEYAEKTFALKFKAEKEIGNTKPKDKPLPKKKKPSDGQSQPTLQEKLQDIYERVYEVAVEYPIPFLLLGSISASLFLVIIFGFFFSTDKKALVERGAATPMRVTQTSDSTASSSANASETATSSESKSDSNNSPLCKEPSLRTSTEVSDDKINAAENIVHQEQEEEAEETTIRRRTKTRKAT
jgi:calnexin